METIKTISLAVEKCKAKITMFDVFIAGFLAGFFTLAIYNIIMRMMS